MKTEKTTPRLSECQILKSCLTLLRVDPGHFAGLWRWSALHEALAAGRLSEDPPATALAVAACPYPLEPGRTGEVARSIRPMGRDSGGRRG